MLTFHLCLPANCQQIHVNRMNLNSKQQKNDTFKRHFTHLTSRWRPYICFDCSFHVQLAGLIFHPCYSTALFYYVRVKKYTSVFLSSDWAAKIDFQRRHEGDKLNILQRPLVNTSHMGPRKHYGTWGRNTTKGKKVKVNFTSA